MTEQRPDASQNPPAMHVGDVVSGTDVIANEALLHSYAVVVPDLLAIEMECAGVYLATQHASVRPVTFMVRGISDLAGEDKNDAQDAGWRAYACDAAATFLYHFLRQGPLPGRSARAVERHDPARIPAASPGISEPPATPHLCTHDLDLFALFQLDLPADGFIAFLDTHNMAFLFDFEASRPMYRFIEEWGRVDHEFENPDLEARRASLFHAFTEYREVASSNWFSRERVEGKELGVPPEWEEEQPERFASAVASLHQNAQNIVDQYKAMIRAGRAKVAATLSASGRSGSGR